GVNRVRLDAAGLYPVMVSACALLSYGLAMALHGSGFLAVYLTGVVVGQGRIVSRRGVLLFHDAGAWLAQIVMFVVLGLLTFPTRLLEVAPQGLGIALVLVFVARPLAVALTLLPFGFRPAEMVFVAWGGLKGAVPITLATFPLLLGLPGGALLFDVVFFVVLVSALTQGWTLPWLARRLGLEVPAEPDPPVTLEIASLRQVDAEIVEYAVREGSRAAGRRIRDLALPQETVVALVTRGERIVMPEGKTEVLPGDRLFVVLRPETQPMVDHVFGRERWEGSEMPALVEFPLSGETTVEELEEFYGLRLDAPPEATLADVVRELLRGAPVEPGSRVLAGGMALVVREIGEDGEVERVGVAILPG
ncbi:MAG TPA: potassium/proton antiporter, partial [Longimicrobiaceae bacterium]